MAQAQTKTELQQIKGIGTVLAQRLTEAGLDSCRSIVDAGEAGLQKIKGIRQQAIPSILEQAKECSEGTVTSKAEQIDTIQGKIDALTDQVHRIAQNAKERFYDVLDGRCGKKLANDLVRIVADLDSIDVSSVKRLKRTGRGLDKARKRVTGLEEASLKKVRKGLKKSRKALLKVLP